MSEEFIYTDYVNDDKFLSDYNEYQARYAEKMRESDKVLVDLLRKYIAERGGETAPKLLDIGCSTGNLLLHLKRTLPGVEMTGGDLAKSSVAEASENPELEGIDFQVMDIFNLPEASFDIIVVNAVVYMFNDEQYEKSLESIAKALTPGGAAFFFDFAQPHNHELEIIEKTMSHPDGLRLCFRSYKRVNTAIEKAGFESIDIQPFVLPIDLPRPDINGEVISYTIRDENAQRMAFRGALYQPWCHMIAHKNNMPKRALFVISIYNYHREVEPVVRRFLKEGWAVDVLLGWRGEAAQVALEAYETYGAHVIHAPQEMCYGFDELVPSNGAEEVDVETQPVFASRKPSVVERIKGFLRQFGLLYFVQNVRSHLKQIENIKLYVETQLDISGYDAAFQGPFHSVGKLDNVVYCALKTQKTPNYCYPVSAYHGRMNAIMARRDNIELGMVSSELFKDHNYINRIFARLFPYWVADFMGKSFFLSDLSLMFASWIKKVELEDVWAKPQPGFRQIFVYSEFSRSFLEDGQFPMEKTVVCGIPLLDESIERLKNEYESKKLFTYLGLEEDEPFVLFNVEPSYEHHYCDKETHWKRFNELMETVTSVGYPVVLSLHPLCRYEDYSFATDKYAVKISTEYKIHDLYPYCALSVSFACSTNILAEIFHKRVIIYDFFNMTQPDSPRAIEFRLPFAEFCYSTEELKEKLSGLCLKSQSLIGTEFLTETATGIIFETVNQNDKELEI